MDTRETLAANLHALRKARGMTQLELAEQLNYSDKSVSKWERGDAVPDIEVLVRLADFYGVPVDYLLREHEEIEIPAVVEEHKKQIRRMRGNRLVVSLLAATSVWIIAIILFVQLIIWKDYVFWMAFLWAIPLSDLVLIVFESIWGRKKTLIFFLSVLLWSLLTCLHLQFISYNTWAIYFVGIPAQIAIILAACFKLKDDGRNGKR